MSALATDNFNRANAANLGANWTIPTGGNAIPITSNQATIPASFPGIEYNNTTSWPNNQYAQIKLPDASGVSDEGMGPAVRITSGGNLYFLQVNRNESRIYKLVSGTFTQLGSDGTAWSANTDVFYLEINGTSLTAKKNGTTIITATDSSISAGNAGIWSSTNGGADFIIGDDWEGGDLGSGSPTITPTGFGTTSSVGTPSVLLSGVQISPTGFGTTVSLGTPAIASNAITMAPTGFGMTSTLGVPSVSTGSAVTINPTGFALTASLGTAVVISNGLAVVPASQLLTTTLGSFITENDITLIGVPSFPMGTSLGTPTVVINNSQNVTMTPTGFLLTSSRGTPTLLNSGILLAPTGFGMVSSLGVVIVNAGGGGGGAGTAQQMKTLQQIGDTG